ncbi:acyl transferase domain-containing protein [Aspergillus avenaceus]|uniref:Acyl transferase domain-containing protein n=1 Tax=Aspergillus avenaceus TaxID=36643 RepID=A0A5N6U421_ASPAV|nr:acyl transferase domain-containing protein [Aspergillus avenaceus]
MDEMQDVAGLHSAVLTVTGDVDSTLPVNSLATTTPNVTIRHKHIVWTLAISNSYYAALEAQKDAFLRSLAVTDDIHDSSKLALKYIGFLLSHDINPHSLIATVLGEFERHFLEKVDIHSLVARLSDSHDERRQCLNIYYHAVSVRHENSLVADPGAAKYHHSSFFHNAQCNQFRIMAVFGGQGDASRTCLQELSELYITYKPIVYPFIQTMGAFLGELSRVPECHFYYQGRYLDVEAWLTDCTTPPGAEFVTSAPVSMPLIGLLSLARYATTCHILGFTPGELRVLLHGTTGHSQGLMASLVIAISDSWESFLENCRLALEALFWIGWDCHYATPQSMIPEMFLTSDRGACGCDISSHMLNIRGTTRSQLGDLLLNMNNCLPVHEQLYLALINSRGQFVVSGPKSSLVHFDSYLEHINSAGIDQSQVPLKDRKPVRLRYNFLPVTAPFHTPYLQVASERLKQRFSNRQVFKHQLAIPVYHTCTGEDLRLSNENILHVVFDAITRDVFDWPTALSDSGNTGTSHAVTHIVVFDRGGLAGLVKRVKKGQGIRVIQGSELDSRDTEIGTMRDLYSPHPLASSTAVQTWHQRFRPRVTQGKRHVIGTRLSALLGTPPIIVAGMTPTTVHWDFVSAIINAGYHVELAGGGYHDAASMESAIRKLVDNIPPERSITCNLIYANPRAIRWQIQLLHRMSRSGVPIDGLTFGAGVPSLEVIAEFLQTLGLRHISFKPGSISSIQQVVDISKAHPDFPIILQWTGGRGGGHHSSEDFHYPILATYGLIRQQPNLYLVAGSGFGTGDSIYPYLTGEWSCSFGYPSMPFDGILLGSCMMVASDSHTSKAAKQLITSASGLENHDWAKTYDGPAGGVITVQSEMGEAIHKLATRGVRFWAEMDNTVFSLPRKERTAYLTEHRERIIHRLDADFAKPWFGRNSEGQILDLCEMTYIEVLNRIVELMYIIQQKRWIDPSYTDFTFAFAIRTLERLPANPEDVANLSRASLKKDPGSFLHDLLNVCPSAAHTILNPEDVSFFLMQAKSTDRKPVNFVPILDDDFEFYFKKDSLWQSEDIDAVIDQDADRVCILHGPVAAQYSKDRGQTAKEILDSIITSLWNKLQQDMPVEESDGTKGRLDMSGPWTTVSPIGRPYCEEELSTPSTTPSDTTEGQSLSPVTTCCSQDQSTPLWAKAVLEEKVILQGRLRQKNPFRCLVEAYPESIIQYDPSRLELSVIPELANTSCSIVMTCHNGIHVRAEVHTSQSTNALQLLYQYHPGSQFTLSEIMEHRKERTRLFYSTLWFGNDTSKMAIDDVFSGHPLTLTRQMLDDLTRVVGSTFPDYRVMSTNSDVIPISMGFIIAWDVIARPLVCEEVKGDLLRLLHKSNICEYTPGVAPLRLGETVSTESQVQAVYVQDTGKIVVIEGWIVRSGVRVMTIIATFLFSGCYGSADTFQRTTLSDWNLHISSSIDEAVLRHRNWFKVLDSSPSLEGKTVVFNVESYVKHKEQGRTSLHVTGSAHTQVHGSKMLHVGDVDLSCDDCVGNPVVEFLQRKGGIQNRSTDFDTANLPSPSSMEIQMPVSNQGYAEVSRDFNPVHVSALFANLAQLPGIITHGMCTSAVTVAVLELLVLEGDRTRLRRFSTEFTGMVLPSETLVVQLQHVGMVEGRMRYTVKAFRKDDDEKVLDGEAEIEQPATAYLFTGQGSQSKGMGMDLYNASAKAKALWDSIDEHLYNAYGWSVLDIVKSNPQTLTVHFGGKQGRRIRQNYLSITTETVLPGGERVQKPVLDGLTSASPSYVFHDPRGLLYSTQFAQPAILLFEAAAFAEMQSKGYVSSEAMYAGHSLGEYGALSSMSTFVPTRALVELAFYRGLIMQASVAQDHEKGITYGMVAVNPQRVGEYFDEASLRSLIRMIAAESGSLLEIVNFNIDGEQYVCSGTICNLYVLGKLMDHIAHNPSGHQQVEEMMDMDASTGELRSVARELIKHAKTLPQPIPLQRGQATIPLQGIEIPFHSSHLRATVDLFRQCLLRPGLFEGHIDLEALEGKYIPNLMAKPFSLDESYIKEAYELTQSPVLGEILGL